MPTSVYTQSTSGQVSKDYRKIPLRPQREVNETEPEKRFISPFSGSGHALCKNGYMEFVKTTATITTKQRMRTTVSGLSTRPQEAETGLPSAGLRVGDVTGPACVLELLTGMTEFLGKSL